MDVTFHLDYSGLPASALVGPLDLSGIAFFSMNSNTSQDWIWICPATTINHQIHELEYRV